MAAPEQKNVWGKQFPDIFYKLHYIFCEIPSDILYVA